MKNFLSLSLFILLGWFIVSSSACRKDTECKAKILTVDSTGKVIAGARVQLFAQIKDPNDPKSTNTHTADVKADGTTDSGGEVQFVFKLPAILDIRSTKTVGTRTLTGQGIIKLEEGKTVEKTVTMK